MTATRETRRSILLTAVLLLASGGASAAELEVPGQFPTIQDAITAAADGDVIVVSPGTYTGTVNPFGKAITIRSTDPDDPAVVASTIIDGAGQRAVAFFSGEQLDTVLEGFTITGGVADEGGGIGIYVSDPLIRKCVVRGNTGTQGGGAYVYASSAFFDEVAFEDNTATDGGGVYAYATTYARFDNCSFTGNIATSDGGAVAGFFAGLRFKGCLIADNSASVEGGAFEGRESSAIFFSSLVRDNVAERGGAFKLDDTSVRLRNTTVVRNTATGSPAGGAGWGLFSSILVRNSIVRDNVPDEFDGFSFSPSGEYSNVTGGLSGPGNIDVDPLFIDPAGDDFRLQAASPSRNTGFNGWVPSYGTRDLDGAPRLLEKVVDMGGYEFRGPRPPRPDGSGALIVAMRDEANVAFGIESPLLRYDDATGEWDAIVRNMPSYAMTADDENNVFWVHSGENGLLGRIPYDTLELEEIGVLKYDGSPSFGLSGLAARDGVLYASVWLVGVFQPDRLYTVDTETATLTLVHEFPTEFEVWDLHYDPRRDRMLVLSSPEDIPPGEVGIYELDLDTFEMTQVQSFFNEDPFSELNSLQGVATGNGKNFIFRAPYNKIEIYDARTEEFIETISVPANVANPPGLGWLFGALSWSPSRQ